MTISNDDIGVRQSKMSDFFNFSVAVVFVFEEYFRNTPTKLVK